MSAHREASGIDTKGTSYLEDIKLDYESNDITQRPSRGETSCPNTLANDGYVVISDGIKTHGLVSPKDSPRTSIVLDKNKLNAGMSKTQKGFNP
jgi:hypothetical protein